MNNHPRPHSMTLFGHPAPSLRLPKSAWIRVNRVLAWALLLAPLVQLLLRTPLLVGLAVEFVMLIAHGVLSLVLFRAPAINRGEFKPSMHLFGFRPRSLSERSRFLLTGYRIAMVTAPPLLNLVSFGLMIFSPLPLIVLYPALRFPLTLVEHIHGAIKYALARRGVRGPVTYLGIVAGIAYIALFLANLFKPS